MVTLPTVTNTAAAANVANAAAGLGALVWWTLTDTRIKPDALRAILAAEGADPSIVPNVDPGTAIRKAAREWREGRGNGALRAEVTYDEAGMIVVGILRREQTGTTEVQWRQVDQIGYHLLTTAWYDLGGTDAATKFRDLADALIENLDDDWIRSNLVIAGLRDLHAVSLRDRGGVYYVAARYGEALDRLARVIRQIGKSRLDIVYAQDTRDARDGLAAAVQPSLVSDYTAIAERLERWTESSRAVSGAAAASLLAEIGDLTAKADLYADALGIAIDGLKKQIDDARTEAMRLIAGE